MPEITVIDYDGLTVDAESRAVTVTVVDGLPAAGVPAGGTTNQVLAKASDADYDVAWVNDGVGGGGSMVTVDADGTVTVDGSGVELATDAQLAAHEADTTGVHGIADTSALVVATDPRLSDARTPTAHAHDDRYYTETEVDTALAGKADDAHTHPASEVTGLAAVATSGAYADLTGTPSIPDSPDDVGAAAATHTHAQGDVTGLTAALDGKADDADLTAHLNDTTDAHDASAISFAPTGAIAATNVQDAIAEVASEAGGGGGGSVTVKDGTGTTIAGVTELRFPGGKVIDLGGGVAEVYALMTAAFSPLHTTYGDECNGGTVAPKWTATGLTVTATGATYSITSASGTTGRLMQSFADTGQTFEIQARIKNLSSRGGMVGILLLNATTGAALVTYTTAENTYHMVTTSAGAYSSTGPTMSPAAVPNLGDSWLRLRRSGSVLYGSFSNNGVDWTAEFTTSSSATWTHIGIARTFASGGGAVTFDLDRFNYGSPSIG